MTHKSRSQQVHRMSGVAIGTIVRNISDIAITKMNDGSTLRAFLEALAASLADGITEIGNGAKVLQVLFTTVALKPIRLLWKKTCLGSEELMACQPRSSSHFLEA